VQSKLSSMACDASIPGPSQREADYNMWHMYERYWQPFGKLLTDMEKEGMLVNRCAAVVLCLVCRSPETAFLRQVASSRLQIGFILYDIKALAIQAMTPEPSPFRRVGSISLLPSSGRWRTRSRR